MSPIERKWWFSLPVTLLALLAAHYLLLSAQVPYSTSPARFVIFALCAVSLQRGLSLCIWLLLLWVAPGLALKKPLSN